MAFAADMHVFPGGRLDPGDSDAALVGRAATDPTEAAVALGGDLEPSVAISLHIAAIRELFEEAGVLLAEAREGGLSSRSVSQARTALVGGDARFAQIVLDLDLRLRTDLLTPLSRWVTPPILPRRFDARFFVAELPTGARVTFEGDEVAGHTWLTRRPGWARWPAASWRCGSRRARHSSSSSSCARSMRYGHGSRPAGSAR